MPNPVTWFEIIGKDADKLRDFYGKAFDWKIEVTPDGGYGMLSNNGEGIDGGIAQSEGISKQVTFYIEVDDPQAYLDKIEAAGGKTVVPVTEIPGMVIFAQFADPEGNVVGMTKAGYPG